jgi:DNA invertase Pin-like site-specific DNA recombinase
MTKLVLYGRVSTSHQGEHGLGIAAQLRALREYAKQGDHEVIRPEYVEVQSSADDSRPILAEAVRQCRIFGAVLCVAKADRLTRTGETVEKFAKRNKIDVVALDNVNGDDVLAEMQAFVGSLERKLISRRTRAALQALKASGKSLGGDRGGRAPDYARELAKATIQANAARRQQDLAPIITEIEAAGFSSDRSIAEELNRRGIVTARGRQWHGATVKAIRERW